MRRRLAPPADWEAGRMRLLTELLVLLTTLERRRHEYSGGEHQDHPRRLARRPAPPRLRHGRAAHGSRGLLARGPRGLRLHEPRGGDGNVARATARGARGRGTGVDRHRGESSAGGTQHPTTGDRGRATWRPDLPGLHAAPSRRPDRPGRRLPPMQEGTGGGRCRRARRLALGATGLGPRRTPSLSSYFIYGRSGSWFLGGSGTPAHAQEVGGVVGVAPVLHYLAVRYAEHVHRSHLHPLAGGSYPLKLSSVGAVHDDTGRHPVPFGHHVLHGDAEIGEARSSLGECLLEGVYELGGRVVWE